MANPPVPPITWVGRDAVGNLVDVTAETSGVMSPLSVASGEQRIRLLGPFTVSHDTPGISFLETGAVVTELEANSIVIQIGVIVRTQFNGSDQRMRFSIGGPDYGPPNEDYAVLSMAINVGGTHSGVG